MDLLEILGAVGGSGEHHRERQILIGRIEQNAEQIQNFFGGAGAARENDDAVPQPHERFQALFDVRHDDQLAHDRIRRLRGDDAGLGDPEVAAILDALFRVADGRPFHGPFHGARAAARADIQAAQPQLIADLFRVVVLEAADGMPAPANHEIGPHLQFQYPGIAQDVKYRIGDAGGRIEIVAPAFHDFVGDEHHVAQHREQMILQAPDHDAVDEGRRGRILDLELDAPRLAHDAQVEVSVLLEYQTRIVDIAAGIEHGERALAKQGIQAALAGIQQLGDFLLR